MISAIVYGVEPVLCILGNICIVINSKQTTHASFEIVCNRCVIFETKLFQISPAKRGFYKQKHAIVDNYFMKESL